MLTRTHAHMHACTHARTHARTHAHTHTCARASLACIAAYFAGVTPKAVRDTIHMAAVRFSCQAPDLPALLLAFAGVTPKAVRDTIHMAGLSYVGSGASEDDEEGDFADMAYNLGAGKFLEQEVRLLW